MEGTPRSNSRRRNSREKIRIDTKTTDTDIQKKSSIMVFKSMMSSMKLFVLCLLCMQNTMFTVLRRYSQGVLKENYSKVSFFTRSQHDTDMSMMNNRQ